MGTTKAAGSGDRAQLSFLGRALPSAFALRVVAIAPGGRRDYDSVSWRDALVVVEHGAIELECLSGRHHRFERGAVLWLAGLPLRALHNKGYEPALLVAVSRRDPMSSAADHGFTV